MGQESVKFYANEVTMTYEVMKGKQKQTMRSNFSGNKIKYVTIEPCQERMLFKSVPSERIVIKADGVVGPIVYYQSKEQEYFEDYKNGFRKFCRENGVILNDKARI